MPTRIARASVASGLVAVAACSGPAAAGGPGPPGGECVIAPPLHAEAAVSPDAAPRPVVVGLPGPVDPSHAPVPRTPAERLLFAQLYETLVRLDCGGRPEPALAASWSVDDGGRTWTFTLRADARDWEGDAVTATDVGSSWTRAQETPARPGAARPSRAFVSLAVLGPRTLRAELPRPVAAGFFARPELAVRTREVEGGWPVGSGPFRPAPRASGTSGAPLRSTTLAGPVPLEMRVVAGDPRDALDQGVDLLVTSDPAVIDYATAGAAFRAVPLPWSRTWLVALGAGVAAPATGTPAGAPPAVSWAPRAALAALARDAVRADARPAEEPTEPPACVPPDARFPPVAPEAARAARVVYRLGDPVARSLAERIVALALDARRADAAWLADAAPGLAGARPVRAAGLATGDFERALRAGGDAAYVVSVDTGRDPCGTLEAAVAVAPWLLGPAPAGVVGGRQPTLLPLIETRGTLLVHQGVGGVSVDGRGVLRLEHVHGARAEPSR